MHDVVVKYLQGSRKKKYWEVKEDIKVTLSNDDKITIPSGFKTDLSSSPKWLWGVFPPYGDFLLAAIIHDFLYNKKTYSRSFSDKEMYLWSTEMNSEHPVDNYARYLYVRVIGWVVWKGWLKMKVDG
jgi:hypothetical protein